MEGSSKTIIFVDNSTGLTGGFKSMAHVIGNLHGAFKMVVVTPDKSFARKHLPEADHYELPFAELQKSWKAILYPVMLIVNSIRLRKIVRKYDNPILHMNDFYNLTGCGVKILSRKTPLVYHVRLLPSSYIGPIYSWLSRVVLKYADRVICCSRAVYQALPESPKKQVIYDAMVEPSRVHELRNDPPEILYLANYIPGKGQEDALEIFTGLSVMHPSVTLRFVGGTLGNPQNEQFREDLMKEALKRGLEGRITFDGFVERVDDEIQRATVLLNCSKSESFSMVCLEGLFNETAVVTLDSGGPAELVKHGETGLIFDLDTSADEIARQIHLLLDDPALRDIMVKKGKAFALQNFSQKETIKDLEEIYTKL